MKKREIDTAARFGLLDRLQALENDLTAIPGTTYIPAPSEVGLFFSVGLLRFPSLPGGFVPAPLRISSDIKEGFFG